MHFITCILYKVVITFKSVDENRKTNKHMKANIPVALLCYIKDGSNLLDGIVRFTQIDKEVPFPIFLCH